jgi:hypothetical protein
LGSSQIFGELFTFFPSQTTTHPFLQNIRVTLGYYDHEAQEIGLSKNSFKEVDEIGMLGNVIAEEMFHAYQNLYSTNTNPNYFNVPTRGADAFKGGVNIEFEAHFFVDLTFLMSTMNTAPAYEQANHTFDGTNADNHAAHFEKWIASITNNYTQMPQNYQAFQGKYFVWVEKFKKFSTGGAYDTPIDYSKTPDALINLIQVSGCNN